MFSPRVCSGLSILGTIPPVESGFTHNSASSRGEDGTKKTQASDVRAWMRPPILGSYPEKDLLAIYTRNSDTLP